MKLVLILLFCQLVLAIDVVKIEADTPFQFGQALARAKGADIKAYFDQSADLSRYIKWFQTEAGKQIFSEFLENTKEKYPDYVEEISGLASGANIPFEHAFMMLMGPELDLLLWKDRQIPVGHCTDILLYDDHPIIAHNEDEDPSVWNSVYFIEANTKYSGNFSALAYPAYSSGLPGCCFGFNAYGVTLTVNAVFPKAVDSGGIGVNILARDVLSASSSAEAIERATGAASAGGGSFNVYSIKDNVMINIETAGGGSSVKFIKTVDWHFNMFTHLNVSEHVDESSVHRKARSAELPTSVNDVKRDIGDTYDPEYPIYRNGSPPDNAKTLATGVFDYGSVPKLYLFRKNPGLNPDDPDLVVNL